MKGQPARRENGARAILSIWRAVCILALAGTLWFIFSHSAQPAPVSGAPARIRLQTAAKDAWCRSDRRLPPLFSVLYPNVPARARPEHRSVSVSGHRAHCRRLPPCPVWRTASVSDICEIVPDLCYTCHKSTLRASEKAPGKSGRPTAIFHSGFLFYGWIETESPVRTNIPDERR